MVRFPKVFLGLFVAVGLTIVSCNGQVPTDVVEDPTVTLEEEPTPSPDKLTTNNEPADVDEPKVDAQPDGPVADKDMVSVSIYVMDDSCSNFTAESVKVPADQAITEAVGEVLDRHDFEAFKLSGYRVNVEDSKAIVDLRLAEDSQRQFLSLSSCEQQGLFGGLEETLLQNSDWQVNQVEFTNRGKEIVL
ncbi:MAG: hypothetical protein KTR27_06250 [Leptolyngbyaceae cyanobacterium MAG.088]|nr:hypothetical protein [Leptolyngbyaceae cyanobacterium MAG.088]